MDSRKPINVDGPVALKAALDQLDQEAHLNVPIVYINYRLNDLKAAIQVDFSENNVRFEHYNLNFHKAMANVLEPLQQFIAEKFGQSEPFEKHFYDQYQAKQKLLLEGTTTGVFPHFPTFAEAHAELEHVRADRLNAKQPALAVPLAVKDSYQKASLLTFFGKHAKSTTAQPTSQNQSVPTQRGPSGKKNG